MCVLFALGFCWVNFRFLHEKKISFLWGIFVPLTFLYLSCFYSLSLAIVSRWNKTSMKRRIDVWTCEDKKALKHSTACRLVGWSVGLAKRRRIRHFSPRSAQFHSHKSEAVRIPCETTNNIVNESPGGATENKLNKRASKGNGKREERKSRVHFSDMFILVLLIFSPCLFFVSQPTDIRSVCRSVGRL